jgi:hypothetical protein
MSIKDKAGKKPTNGPWSYVEEVISGIHQKHQGFYVDGEKQGVWSVHHKEDHIEGEEGEFLGWEVTYMHGVIKRFSENWSVQVLLLKLIISGERVVSRLKCEGY